MGEEGGRGAVVIRWGEDVRFRVKCKGRFLKNPPYLVQKKINGGNDFLPGCSVNTPDSPPDGSEIICDQISDICDQIRNYSAQNNTPNNHPNNYTNTYPNNYTNNSENNSHKNPPTKKPYIPIWISATSQYIHSATKQFIHTVGPELDDLSKAIAEDSKNWLRDFTDPQLDSSISDPLLLSDTPGIPHSFSPPFCSPPPFSASIPDHRSFFACPAPSKPSHLKDTFIEAMLEEENTFSQDPPPPLSGSQLPPFELFHPDEYDILDYVHHPLVENHKSALVPSQITEELFWKRLCYKVAVRQEEAAVIDRLLENENASSEPEISWED